MRRSSAALLASVAALLLAACGGAPRAVAPPPTEPLAAAPATSAPMGPLAVFAAASLTDAFEELGTAFETTYPGAEITYNFAGSQQLAAQLSEGAPADVFASANIRQMEVATEGGRIVSGTAQAFARNRLVVITPSDNPAGIATLQDLAQPGLKLILADRAVPVGQYSLDVLAKASALPGYTEAYSPTVLANVVSYEENVRSVLTKVALGEGDAGIVYTTDAALAADQLRQIAIPDALNTIASYPIAPVADSANPALAEAFIAFVLSPDGQAILAKYGFIPLE